MVLYDPHRRWGPRGICSEGDWGLFFADGGHPSRKPAKATQARWDQAKEICRMCPVLAECQRDTLGEEYGVFGGRDQYERHLIRKQLRQAVKRWPEDRQLAWGREIHRLRSSGMYWRTIQTQTGLPPSAAELLMNLWEEHLKALPAAPEVVDLDLPEESTKKDFPDRPGRRDAWVRTNGLVRDAWYRGQTPDGKWIYLTTYSGRGQVHKWAPADDVHLYRPQAVVILNYRARPDRDDHTPAA